MKVFISGGCKNGKSTIAENIAVKLADGGVLYYMATMIPHDEEDRVRIARHVQARKGKGFITVECGESLCDALQHLPAANAQPCSEEAALDACRTDNKTDKTSPTFLVDAVTALVSNHYDQPELALEDLKQFCARVGNAVFVSDFIYSAEENYSEYTELYRKGLAACDHYLASTCDVVIEVCAGQTIVYKGKELL